MALAVRPCVLCGQEDDHPKHVVTLQDGSDFAKHMDCCANNGCDVCTEQTKNQGKKRGDDFRAVLTADHKES